MVLRVSGLLFGAQGVGFGVLCLELRLGCLVLRNSGLVVGVKGFGLGVWCPGFRVRCLMVLRASGLIGHAPHPRRFRCAVQILFKVRSIQT